MHCNFNDLNVQLIQSFTDYEIILIQYICIYMRMSKESAKSSDVLDDLSIFSNC